MINKILIFTFIILLTHCAIVLAQDENFFLGVEIEKWGDLISEENFFEKIKHKTSIEITNLLYKQLKNIKLINLKGEHYSTGIFLRRRVFDNENGTYTIVDKIVIPLSIFPINKTTIGTQFTKFQLGTKLGFEIADFLVVDAKNPPEIQTIRNKYKDLLKLNLLNNIVFSRTTRTGEKLKGDWIIGAEGLGKQAVMYQQKEVQISNRAQAPKFHKLLNLISFPLRVPLQVKNLTRMHNGEVVSYLVRGAIELGLGAGIHVSNVDDFLKSELGASAKVYLEGLFRVSILKENERFVKIKVFKQKTLGDQVELGAELSSKFFKGVIVLQNIEKQFKIIPYKILTDKKIHDSFELTYRYDLNNDDAREAYENAVYGRLSMSEELSMDGERFRDISEKGACKVKEESIHGNSITKGNIIRLSIISKKKHKISLSTLDIVQLLPDGEKKSVKVVVDNIKSQEYLSLWREENNYRFSFSVDFEEYLGNKENFGAIVCTVEGTLVDTNTEETELQSYILEAEDNVSQYGFFPRPPPAESRVGLSSKAKKVKNNTDDPLKLYAKNNLGKSRFYYRLDINYNLLKKFINVPDEEKWGYIEKAFGVKSGTWSNKSKRTIFSVKRFGAWLFEKPLSLFGIHYRRGTIMPKAKRIYTLWQDLKNHSSIRAQIEALGELFFNKHYSIELIRLLRFVLQNEEVSYALSGYNSVLGRHTRQGKTRIDPYNKAFKEHEILMNKFKNETYLYDPDFFILTQDLFVLRFGLKLKPAAMYFELYKKTETDSFNWFGLGDSKKIITKEVLSSIIVENEDLKLFTLDSYPFSLDKAIKTQFWYPLVKSIDVKQITNNDSRKVSYWLKIAVNPNGLFWGKTHNLELRWPNKEEIFKLFKRPNDNK